MRKKPTTTTISLWNVTGAVTITTHADEAHKSVALVDFTVKLGDTDTVRDLLTGIGRILDLPEPQRDLLTDIVVLHPEKLKQLADNLLVKRVLKC